jgi:hypothetical protein
LAISVSVVNFYCDAPKRQYVTPTPGKTLDAAAAASILEFRASFVQACARHRRLPMPAEQNFATHTRWFPPFHFFVMPVLLVNLGVQVYWSKDYGFSFRGVFGILVALALILGFLTCRRSALIVQDRVIRLEEQLRYMRLFPADLQPRIDEFTIGQLVSLRFASDAELPSLARKVLDGKMQNRKEIKQMIQNWRPDHVRG